MIIISTYFVIFAIIKKKMNVDKKAKKIYTLELLLFVAIFLVLGSLIAFGVIKPGGIFLKIFTWVTLFGSSWLLADFLWTLLSKKRRAANSLLDKILVLPLFPYLVTIDIFSLVSNFSRPDLHRVFVSILFFYIASVYLFQAIYHWKYPIPALFEIENNEEDKKEGSEEKPNE